jgi:hypothetical protein
MVAGLWTPCWAKRPDPITISTSPYPTVKYRRCANSSPLAVIASECAMTHGNVTLCSLIRLVTRLMCIPITLDDAGNNVYGVPYERKYLTGKGSINGYPVRCISAEWMVKFHTSYELDENDFRDVQALCKRFGVPLPDDYLRLTRSDSTPDN